MTILIAPHLLFSDKIAHELKLLGARFALFCDQRVAELFGERWCAHLQSLGLDVSLFTFPDGEQEKNRERKAELEDLLLSQKFGRDTTMIALGGGVTTDLIGFLASTYCRGVPLINVPTTLLGMVDAAIGGKTGINTRFGKNLIGTFYPASKILIDPTVLESLPTSEWISGLGEVIKYGLIRSKELFHALENWQPKNPTYLEKILKECVAIKTDVVKADFNETGLRRILNFGHTIGHALELLENYRMPHGLAVAIGMLVESHMSVTMGLLSPTEFKKIESLIRSFPFTLRLSPAVTLESLLSSLSLDKKSKCGTPRFVLLEKIGACAPFDGEYCSEVPEAILKESLSWMLDTCSGGSS